MVRRILSILGALGVSAAALVAFLRLAAPASAAGPIVVNPGESIQAAIDGASAGDTILIMAGTYTESLTLNKAIRLTGVSSATTILMAEPNNRVLMVAGSGITGQVVISGLMITGGDVRGLRGGEGSGGGVAIQDDAYPIFYNVTFYNNRAVVGGGLWANEQSQPLLLDHTVFISNTAEEIGGGIASAARMIIVNSSFINNHCTMDDCEGGGVLTSGWDTVVMGSSFFSNTAAGMGGGIYGNSSHGMNILSTTIANNSCTESDCVGGGLAAEGPVTLTHNVFVNNTAGGSGAALYSRQWNRVGPTPGNGGMLDRAVLVNNLFVNNTAEFGKGALYLEAGVTQMVHNTIAGAVFNDGPAVYVDGGTAAITNTIITSHEIGIENEGGMVSEDYNLYFDNGVNLSGTVASGGSSMDGDPDFVDPAGGDFHIGADSAALDNALDLGIPNDLDGNIRPYGAGPDRGAYEFVETTWQIYVPVMLKP